MPPMILRLIMCIVCLERILVQLASILGRLSKGYRVARLGAGLTSSIPKKKWKLSG